MLRAKAVAKTRKSSKSADDTSRLAIALNLNCKQRCMRSNTRRLQAAQRPPRFGAVIDMAPEVRAKRGIISAQRQMIPTIRCHKGAGRAETTRKRSRLAHGRKKSGLNSRQRVALRSHDASRGKVEAPCAHSIVRAAEDHAERANSSQA